MASLLKNKRLFTTLFWLLIEPCLLPVNLVCLYLYFFRLVILEYYKSSFITWHYVTLYSWYIFLRCLLGWYAFTSLSHYAFAFAAGRHSTRWHWRNDGSESNDNCKKNRALQLRMWNEMDLKIYRPIWEQPFNLVASDILWDVMFMMLEVI